MARYICVITVALFLWANTPASAQYFGRNKVQYKKLDFKVLKTAHFDIYYYPEEKEGIELAARLAERWHARLERMLSHQLSGRQPLILYASHIDFEQTNTLQGELGEGTGGVTESLRRRIILPLGGSLADTDHVIGHELVHAFQFDITSRPNAEPGETGAGQLPLWFIEGMAEYLSLGPVDPDTAMWLRDASSSDRLPTIKDLDNPKYFPYRWGHAFWAYVGGRWGDDAIARMLEVASAPRATTDTAIQTVLGLTTTQLSDDWHAAIRQAYAPLASSTTPPSELGTVVVGGRGRNGELNVGPALSPDGKLLAFLSMRSLISIDLYIADVASGRVTRKLTSTATDPHYSSLQFIYSSGGWDAASRHIAIATVTGGKPALAIFDAKSGHRDREVRIDGIDEIFNPTWSPDGRTICFTGMARGLTDLYVVDVSSGTVRALTHDAFADLQPVWSPDGRRVAFATDRFTTTLDTLAIGNYRIGVMDVETGRIAEVRSATEGKSINPQWAPDGQSIYFIGDHDGIANLYQVAVEGGTATRLTNVLTGLSGISRSSPALSISARTGVAAFSVYNDGGYAIYTRDVDHGNAGGLLQRDAMAAAALPPIDRRPSEVQRLLSDARFGLPAATTYPTVDYSPRLQIEAIGQPTVGVGVSQFGTSLRGGLSASFRDMLGDHNLDTLLQINQGIGGGFSIRDTAAQAQYLNQSRRWNWGVIGGQVPYLSGGGTESTGTVNGEPSVLQDTIVLRQTQRTLAGIVAYPISRAQRLEFQAGVSRLSFDQVVRTQAFSLITGGLIADDTNTTQIGAPLTLATSSAALVFDTSTFGATSPVSGQRYRLEAAPSFGTISYTSMLADYRRYVMPVPFYTIAARVLHYGLYGTGADDERLSPLYLGYPGMVRGYSIDSINPSECVANAFSSCPAFDRLVGKRLLVGNLELRFPLLRPFTGPSPAMYGPVPLEIGFFLDGGVAWNRAERPTFLGGEREGISSTGVTLRTNLLGFAIGEFSFARPLARVGQGWVFQFNFAPGF